jgi:acyl-coenzyme A synthetase/AMP-(fatty) acid ligase
MPKRAVICVPDPWNYLDQFPDHSIMFLNPSASQVRNQWLLDQSDWSIMLDSNGVRHREGRDFPDEKIVMYTSGTTGDSRIYGFTASQVQSVVDRIIQDYEITDRDRYASIMPVWHAHGLLFMLAARESGCEIQIADPKNLESLEQFQPTFLTAIPDIARLFVRFELDHLRFIRTASQALTDAVYQSLKDRFRVPVIEAFGMTESCSHCFTNPLQGEQRVGTIGLPSGIEARIDDQQHLWISGPSIHTTAWFDTGDLASQDPAGYFRILGRSLDRINVRGYKIDPLSVENQLYNRFPEIRECAVFGRDRLKCIVVGEADLDQVRHFLSSLAEACRPRLLVTVDSVPKNANGKISRSLLDSMY